MSYERDLQIKVYLQIPYEKRQILENDFRQLKRKFQLSIPGGDSYVAELIQNIANIMVPKHGLSDEEFLGLAHYFTENEYKNSPSTTASSSSDSGSCFVATVCCGTEDQWEVTTLKKFRDTILVRTPFGQKFINKYYKWGPIAAIQLQKTIPLYKVIIRFLVIKPLAVTASILVSIIPVKYKK